jgi:hypothetical protein
VALDLRDLTFAGAALPEPFVKLELEAQLQKFKLLPKLSREESAAFEEAWEVTRRKLRRLGEQGGPHRVADHVLAPLAEQLGYTRFAQEDEPVITREGAESAGWRMVTADGAHGLRAWAVDLGADLDAPSKRGRAYRFSHARIAERVLLAKGERVGLLTDGYELRLVLCDPARAGSHVSVRLDRVGGWRGATKVPDSFRLLRALCAPTGLAKLPELLEQARLSQTRVTKTLRAQAQDAVLGFVQGVLDDPRNATALAARRAADPGALARDFWRESLLVVYRLLFILRLESASDPARAFSFASTSLWRNSFSPNTALAPFVRMRLDKGVETGALLSQGLRTLFRLFEEGLDASEIRITPLGGMLFGTGAAPLLTALAWSEDAVARLLDRLLWTPGARGRERQRVHYGSLEVEDLGRVYEALLEKEPGLAAEPMCRLRRQKLEVVLPLAQGARYRPATVVDAGGDDDDSDDDDSDDEGAAKKARVEWIEEIPAGRFYLRTGLGRKATGSYYTPDAFVRFLVEKTLGPQVAERSPVDDPQPLALLGIKVLDPAMGSGHFLVGACRFLAEKLYEACRLCDERARALREKADATRDEAEKARLVAEADALLQRVADLPDPNDELLAYLPSRVAEGAESALSQSKAEAMCRRLVAVHGLYGVDKNPLAVELARLALWLESYAEGLPLTFLDHRLVCGDSLTGPFVAQLATMPGGAAAIDTTLFGPLTERLLAGRMADALAEITALQAGVGKDLAEVERKRAAKERLDAALAPFRMLASVWSGGVMLGAEVSDDLGYTSLVALAVQSEGDPLRAMEALLADRTRLREMHALGRDAVSYDLTFPEVFWPKGYVGERAGFDAVLGNPPWDAVRRNDDAFFADVDISVLDQKLASHKRDLIEQLLKRVDVRARYTRYVDALARRDRVNDRIYASHQARVGENLAGRGIYDDYILFAERARDVLAAHGRVGVVLPSGFHANEGATGLRRLYLEQSSVEFCYSFENREKLFEIDSRFKFALIVARRAAGAGGLSAAFYLRDPEVLFSTKWTPIPYSQDLLRKAGGDYLSLLELRSALDAECADTMFRASLPFGRARRSAGIVVSQEVNMTYDAGRFASSRDVIGAMDPREPSVAEDLLLRGYLPLHEGKTFHQYTDRWEAPPRYLVALRDVADKPAWIEAARYFRLAFRDIASSTNERTGIFCIAPPGVLFGNTAPCERSPSERAASVILGLLGLLDSYAFDWILRQKNAAHVNLFILDGCPVPSTVFDGSRRAFLAHGALRLTCNHAGYAPLWREQLGDHWRESTPRESWPVLAGDDARWAVRAAIDAVIAQAYGLTRAQYAHVLGGFSHKSYPKAPALCLERFDELARDGMDAFVRRWDPYWDVPLVETLPKPVIELRVPAAVAGDAAESGTQLGFAGIAGGETGGRRVRKKKE